MAVSLFTVFRHSQLSSCPNSQFAVFWLGLAVQFFRRFQRSQPLPQLRHPYVAPDFLKIAKQDASVTTTVATTAAAMRNLLQRFAPTWLVSRKAHPNAMMKAQLAFQTQRLFPAKKKPQGRQQPVLLTFLTAVKEDVLLTMTAAIRAAVIRKLDSACAR